MEEVHYPYEFFFDGAGDVQTHLMSTNRYEEISKLVIKLIDDKDKDYTGEAVDEQRGRLAGCVIRTAGHDFMDYRIDGGGGSDGCFNLKDPDNKGL